MLGPPPDAGAAAQAQQQAFVDGLIARAGAARDARQWRDAAVLYSEALRFAPDNAGLQVQCGHMYKEAGDLVSAGAHYGEALRLTPDDPDLALQMGHFHKVAGRLEEAAREYARAAELSPAAAEPQLELIRLNEAGLGFPGFHPRTEAEADPDRPADSDLGSEALGLDLASAYGRLAPEILPRSEREMMHASHDSVNLRQFGVRQNTFWGDRAVLRGVEAIRGFCISTVPIVEVQALVNGLPIYRGPPMGPYELEYEPNKNRTHKYVFNIWFDFSLFVRGRYDLELRCVDALHNARQLGESFVVEPPISEGDHPDSDGIINLSPGAQGSVDDQINARPSVVHSALRPHKMPSVRSILVARADQLGDLVASIPGIMRLRELFPDARIVGLFGPDNVELARTLGVFDDLVVVDYKESMFLRTRTLDLEKQKELRLRLESYDFDVAIDLSQSLMSRPMLALANAKFAYGFKDPNWPRLSSSYEDLLFDAKNRKETAAHSTRILTMIDRLGALTTNNARVIRRTDLSRERLEPFGVSETDRYAVLHTGARIVFSRWAHYLELASRLLAESDLKVVLFTGDAELKDRLPPDLADTDRFIVIDRQLPFDDFDALLSFATVFVGNDSGPKHLASLRGVDVVSIHSARINWSEWGQELTGVIVSRKVPCAGCTLYHDVDECGKDYVCIKAITVDEVYDQVKRYI